jgi:hypothetical protein
MRIKMGYPSREDEKEIFRSQSQAHPLSSLQAVISSGEVLQIQEAVRAIPIDESIIDYALQIVEKTRHSEFLSLGVSPRIAGLVAACQSRAYVQGRDYCLPDDVKRLANPVLAHRIVANQRTASTLRRNEEAERACKISSTLLKSRCRPSNPIPRGVVKIPEGKAPAEPHNRKLLIHRARRSLALLGQQSGKCFQPSPMEDRDGTHDSGPGISIGASSCQLAATLALVWPWGGARFVPGSGRGHTVAAISWLFSRCYWRRWYR